MAAPKKPNQGYLNSNRKGNDKHPDFRAEVAVDSKFIKGLADAAGEGGAVIYMAGWKGTSQKTGDPYVFLRLDSEKYEPQPKPSPKTGQGQDSWGEAEPF